MYETFDALYRQAITYYDAKDYAAVLDLLQREGGRFPKEQSQILYLESTMAARVGQPEQAEAYIAQALDAGLWFGETMLRQTPSWASLQGRPEFERLAAISLARAKEFAGVPRRFVAEPGGGIQPGQRYPLLLALHGNMDTGEAALRAWQPVTQDGWIVASLQSSQVEMDHAYVWDNLELSTGEIVQHYAELAAQYPIDAGRIVMIGFSMGSSVTLGMALTGTLPLRGFILLGPGGADEDWMPNLLAEPARGAPLRGVVLYGEREENAEGVQQLVARLQALDIPILYETLPGLAHAYPDDGGATLRRALAFVEG